jgi:dTDP-4-dehydrorhamnose reductase
MTERSDPHDKSVLILGATGMAGRPLVETGKRRGYRVVGASRAGSDVALDISDTNALQALVRDLRPDLIINTVADVVVGRCEENPGQAWCVNARPVAFLADLAREIEARLVHISTDHFFSGHGRTRHDEQAPVTLLNEYARTKFAAEGLAMTWSNSVVVRTNIVGLRPGRGDSFAEWCLDVIRHDLEATLFDDQFVSCIDVWSFSEFVFDLAETNFCGLVNVASRDVFSKAEFASALAKAEGKTMTRAKVGSVGIQTTRRPDSLGLDVSLAENIIGRAMPSLADVVSAIHQRVHNSEN